MCDPMQIDPFEGLGLMVLPAVPRLPVAGPRAVSPIQIADADADDDAVTPRRRGRDAVDHRRRLFMPTTPRQSERRAALMDARRSASRSRSHSRRRVAFAVQEEIDLPPETGTDALPPAPADENSTGTDALYQRINDIAQDVAGLEAEYDTLLEELASDSLEEDVRQLLIARSRALFIRLNGPPENVQWPPANDAQLPPANDAQLPPGLPDVDNSIDIASFSSLSEN